MTQEGKIIGLGAWLQTPSGTLLQQWEQAAIDQAVADVFGYHALQIGLPEVDALRNNRMPHRWLCVAAADDQHQSPDFLTHPEALPFSEQSLDLVVMPHGLETAVDPHLALSEVVRVLRPEGRLVIVGLNPTSLWALRQATGKALRGLGLGDGNLFLPEGGEFIGYWRLRDWLKLLGMEVEQAQFGCWRPALQSPRWLQRWQWLDAHGERWWPVMGAAYMVVAVKRMRGMRIVGLSGKVGRVRGNAATTAVQQQGQRQVGRD